MYRLNSPVHTQRKLKSVIHGKANKLAAANSVLASTTKLSCSQEKKASLETDRQTDNQEESEGGKEGGRE